MAHPEGESKRGGLRVDFDRRLKLEFHGSKITSDAGLLPFRELDDVLGLSEIAGEHLVDPRTGRKVRNADKLKPEGCGAAMGGRRQHVACRARRAPRSIINRKWLSPSHTSYQELPSGSQLQTQHDYGRELMMPWSDFGNEWMLVWRSCAT